VARVELSFVLPAYNEGDSIESALGSLYRAGRDTGLKYEIVVVDDGSLDDTGVKAVDFASKNGHVKNGFVKLVTYRDNVGKGHAVKTGFLRACGDAVVFVDSDLDIDVEQVGRYVEALGHGDIVVGSKWHPESIVDVPLLRRVLSCGFNVLVRLLTGVRLRDTQTGLKAIRRQALEDAFPCLAVKRYAFDVELLVVARLLRLKVVEMPVRVRLHGMFGVREVWRMFVDLLGIAYRLRVKRWYQGTLKCQTL
jgi:glycosyltransferase involved in cell wall biosynthesis